MKSLNFFLLALLTFGLMFFTSCKDDSNDDLNPKQQVNYAHISFLKDHFATEGCVKGLGFCLEPLPLLPEEVDSVQLPQDEFLSRVKAEMYVEDIRFLFSGTLIQLSEEAKKQILEDRIVVIKEGFNVPEELVKQAFENSGRTYNGETIEVPAGQYEVQVEQVPDDSGTLRKIKIKIKVGKVEITIEIEIE